MERKVPHNCYYCGSRKLTPKPEMETEWFHYSQCDDCKKILSASKGPVSNG